MAKDNYIFPNFMANSMKKVSMNVQLEASMMSMALILIGMILMSIYTLIYMDQSMAFKILLVVNMIAGFIFMSSTLVTTYQQYVSYLGVMEIQDAQEQHNFQAQPHKINKKNRFLFFFGLILIIAGITSYFNLPLSIDDLKLYISGGAVFLGVIFMMLVFRKPKKMAIKEEVYGN